jgi:hypothetical protein
MRRIGLVLFVCDTASTHLSGNGDLNLNTGLDVDDDLLDNLGGGVKARSRSVCCSSGLHGVAVGLTR